MKQLLMWDFVNSRTVELAGKKSLYIKMDIVSRSGEWSTCGGFKTASHKPMDDVTVDCHLAGTDGNGTCFTRYYRAGGDSLSNYFLQHVVVGIGWYHHPQVDFILADKSHNQILMFLSGFMFSVFVYVKWDMCSMYRFSLNSMLNVLG